MASLRITWKKSLIGQKENQRRTIKALGLHRLHQIVERQDTPTIRGMVQTVQHLVEVEKIS